MTRLALNLAALYNLAFGAWAVLLPGSFFAWLGIAEPQYPSVWACLGMVIGLYGVLYAWAARHDAQPAARWIVGVGLLGKIAGPIGMVLAIRSGELPPRAFQVCVFNDLIWWLPFAAFLLRGTRALRAAPWLCAGLHAAAMLVLLLVLRHGGQAGDDPVAFVREHTVAWRAGWAVWMASAMSLVAFYAWWGGRGAVLLAAAGMACDLAGEGLFIGRLTEVTDPDLFASVLQRGTLLTAGAANGLYTLGGVLLTLRSRGLPRPVLAAQWVTWAAGGAMTVSALAGSTAGLVASSAVLFPLLVAWTAWMALRWRGS